MKNSTRKLSDEWMASIVISSLILLVLMVYCLPIINNIKQTNQESEILDNAIISIICGAKSNHDYFQGKSDPNWKKDISTHNQNFSNTWSYYKCH